MSDESPKEFTLDELAELTGQPRRNIRFLISEQVVPEPHGKKRWATYGPEHVQALAFYSDLKAQGITSLDVIRERIRDAREGNGALVLQPVQGVEIRIESSVLEEVGAEALVKEIGEAIKRAEDLRKDVRK